MTQTIPASAILGPGATGLTIGYRILNLDGTTYSAFSTTGVAETSTAGTYRKTGGVVAPTAGAYIVWGTALVDYAEDEIMPAFGYTGSATGTGAYYEDLLADLMGTGSGTYSYSNTVDDGSGNLLDGVSIQLATDSGFVNVVTTTHTNASGAFTVRSDTAGTHYLRLQLAGYSFTDQTVVLA